MYIETSPLIEQRLKEFAQIYQENDSVWFSELCFCILTANSKALSAIAIQKEIGVNGFLNRSESEIKDIIRKHGHRFHNNKAKYIVEARKFSNIKTILTQFTSSQEARDFLVENIKGLGYKEASHFMRNVGYHDLAIIDRHILRFLLQQNLINQIPKTITKSKYLDFENILKSFNIPQDKLDLMIWFKMTGSVLK